MGKAKLRIVTNNVTDTEGPLCIHFSPPPPGVLGILGEWLFIFRGLGSTGNYFQGFGEQARSFCGLREPCKKNIPP